MLVSSRFIMRQDLLPLFFQWDSRDPVSESLEAMMTGMTTELNTGLCGKPHMAQACGLGICVFIHSFIQCKLAYVCVHAKSLQSCPTLCDLMDCSPSGSSVRGILQARTLEWVAMPSSRGSS